MSFKMSSKGKLEKHGNKTHSSGRLQEDEDQGEANIRVKIRIKEQENPDLISAVHTQALHCCQVSYKYFND